MVRKLTTKLEWAAYIKHTNPHSVAIPKAKTGVKSVLNRLKPVKTKE